MISNNSTPVQGTNTTFNLESLPPDVQEPLDFEYATKEINDKLQTDMEGVMIKAMKLVKTNVHLVMT